jgi:phosphoribosylglycinamide formyltransferase-1
MTGLHHNNAGLLTLHRTNPFTMPRLAVFASGNGTNAQRIAEYFAGHPTVSVSLILSNSAGAFVLKRAEMLGIPTMVFNREAFYGSSQVAGKLQEAGIDFIILAGFLWLIPPDLLAAYPGRIINIHPALLPKYGGRGMYGMKVHQAVIASNETESGITVHYVNERYDEGEVIFQAKCAIAPEDTPESLAEKVHALEYANFAEVIERVVTRDA